MHLPRLFYPMLAIFVFSGSSSANDPKTAKLPEVVTITDMQMGDVACYLAFKDAKNKIRHADASHDICIDTALLNQKATITYRKVNMLAARRRRP